MIDRDGRGGNLVISILQKANRALLAVALLAPIFMTISSSETKAAQQTLLVLGRYSQEPRKHIGRLRAMADHLTGALAGDGVTAVDVLVVDSVDALRSMLREGKIDIISETPFLAFDLVDAGVADILLREWKGGVPEYRSVIVARRDGPVRDIADLTGRKFAFEDEESTSGYLAPRAALEAAGLVLAALRRPHDPVPDGKVGYAFARGEINVIAWVNRGLADAGSVSNLDWENPKDTPENLKKDLVIIHETELFTRSLLLVRRGLDTRLKTRIRDILETMHETPEGRATLKSYFKVRMYDRLEGEALRGLEVARELYRGFRG